MPHGQTPRHVRRKKSAGGRRRKQSPKQSEPPDLLPLSGVLRLQKVLAAAGVASRRAAEELIRAGRVSVNGKAAEIGCSIDPAIDIVRVDGEKIRAEKPRYWILHKPKGVLTTLADPHGRRTVRDLIPGTAGRVHPVGRLDLDSSGLVLLTNDGALTQKLLHPSRESEKEYRVTFKGELTDRDLKRLRQGVHLDDGPSKPVRIEGLRFESERGISTCQLTLTEGRKRQIRRMLLRVGHPVKKLVRIRMGPIRLGRLGVGLARSLRADEVRALRRYVEDLDAAQKGSAGKPQRIAAKTSRSLQSKAAGRKKPTKSRA